MFALIGAVLPQEGAMTAHAIAMWQRAHPILTKPLRPLGFFRIFHSWGFLVTVVLLAVNTLTCTILSMSGKTTHSSGLATSRRSKRIGFLVLHVSIVVLLAGAFVSAGTRLDGFILLTEGQKFAEEHDGYRRIAEGPLRHERHNGFELLLESVRKEYDSGHLIGITSTFEITHRNGKTISKQVAVNRPLMVDGLSFTQDETGFSPRIIIRDKRSGEIRLNSFVALKTFRTKEGREYRDFLPLPLLGSRVIVTLYPSFAMKNGEARKTGEQVTNPLLVIETEDESGRTIETGHLELGGEAMVGGFSFRFEDLRHWSSFKVVDDPGYPVVCVALCLAIIGLITRYSGDLRDWHRE